MKTNKISYKKFKSVLLAMQIIDCKFQEKKPNEESQFYINNLEPIISILLEQIFGPKNSDLIWSFINGKSVFNNIEELYDFVTDDYSELVSTNSALTLDQLSSLFPNEEMFKYFLKKTKIIC